jgi:hypothetical protein
MDGTNMRWHYQTAMERPSTWTASVRRLTEIKTRGQYFFRTGVETFRLPLRCEFFGMSGTVGRHHPGLPVYSSRDTMHFEYISDAVSGDMNGLNTRTP